MITGETLIKGLFYFMLKARGGKFESKKQVAGKDGKLKWVYKYAKKKGEKSKPSPEKSVKQSKPKADSKNTMTPERIKEIEHAIDNNLPYSFGSKEEENAPASLKKKHNDARDRHYADKDNRQVGEEMESLYKKHKKLNVDVASDINHKKIKKLIAMSKKGGMSKQDARQLKTWTKEIRTEVNNMQKRYDKDMKEKGKS